jgi:nucleotide-binding universal stress UspA family protein
MSMPSSVARQSIVVALDGSPLAEIALPKALMLAKLPAAEVILLHVIAPIANVIEDVGRIALDEQWDNEKRRGLRYLESICSRLEWRDLNVRAAVEMGPPADTILDFARAQAADWIVLSTHGRSGVRRWVYGSVADKVLRAARTTVVLVRAGWPNAEAST